MLSETGYDLNTFLKLYLLAVRKLKQNEIWGYTERCLFVTDQHEGTFVVFSFQKLSHFSQLMEWGRQKEWGRQILLN